MRDLHPSPTLAPPGRWIGSNLLRWVIAALLVLGIFGAGMYADVVRSASDQFWQQLLTLVGLTDRAAALQQGISGLVTKRSLVSVVTYSLLYTSGCLLLLAVVLNTTQQVWRVLQLYGAVFTTCAALFLLGKLAGDAPWAYQLARRLIDFIVSPLPVIILVPLLRWYQPAEVRHPGVPGAEA
ncbi:hypothetical protein GCM10022408_28890 [Hymenobacter fastidiosus]|uniref:DUF2127 domain-containing protein n=1 Tax=Hymenobacter fastidiosus TaxID=486264 RepID=A0ABP7SP02_9BACT